MLGINTNTPSLFAQIELNKASKQQSSAITRLSSGLRVNGAKDDAAGLAISEGLLARIRGQEVAKRNSADGISLLEVVDGAASSISDRLQRLRELAVQCANGLLSDDDQAMLGIEANQITAEIDRIIDTTKFNDIGLMDGSAASVNIQVGEKANDKVAISLDNLAATVGALVVDFDNQLTAQTAIGNIDIQIDNVTRARSKYGSSINKFDAIISNLATSTISLNSARGRIMDADFARETSNLTRAQILKQSGVSVLVQANQLPSSVLSLLR